jgi:hypothetical protein
MTDSWTNQTTAERESRARDWIEQLASFSERYAGGASERRAAEQIAGWMRALGMCDATVLPAPGGVRAGLALGVHAGVAALGCFWGGFIGVLLSMLAAWSFWQEFVQHRSLLARLTQPADSVNVIARAGAVAPTRRVVLTAHIDTAQAGWLFSRTLADGFARINQVMRRRDGQPPAALSVPAALLIGAVVVSLGSWLGAHGFLFGVVRLLNGIALLVACGLGLQWAASPPTPGANDNASAVAAMLTCAERLFTALPEDTELWVVGTGAEEVGCGGMRAFVEQHPWPAEGTYWVNFECVGGGALHYLHSEGLLSRMSYTPTLIELARRVAASGAFGEVTPTNLLAATDGHVPAERGYAALSLISLESTGVPRHYHRTDDTVDGIDLTTVIRAADFGAAVVIAALKGEAGAVTAEASAVAPSSRNAGAASVS